MHEQWGLNKEAFKKIVSSKVATRDNIGKWVVMIKQVVDVVAEARAQNREREPDDREEEVDWDIWNSLFSEQNALYTEACPAGIDPPSVSWARCY